MNLPDISTQLDAAGVSNYIYTGVSIRYTSQFNKDMELTMKEYKLVYLNKGLTMSREKDLEQAQVVLNKYVSEGWELQHIISPSDGFGTLVGVFYKEK